MAPNGPATPPTPTVDSESVRKEKAEAGVSHVAVRRDLERRSKGELGG